MRRVLTTIELKEGVTVELLVTPALFSLGKSRGMKIEISDTNDYEQVADAYMKLLYLAAINAHEVRRFDHPELGDFAYSLMDFADWRASNRDAFGQAMDFALVALTGKSIRDYAKEGAKPSDKPEIEVSVVAEKKKNIWRLIMSRLRHFWSVIVGRR